MKKIWGCITFFICAVSLSPAWAQSYPDRPVKLVVPWAPGGIADIMGRLLGQKLSVLWGQPVVIENRPGASSNIGTALVAKSAPDGYTLLLTTSSIAVNSTLFTNPGYELEKNITGVINVAWSPNIIASSNKLGVNNLQEALTKAKNNRLSYASPGLGTTAHLAAEYVFKVMSKVDIVPIPYNGAGPAINALVAADVDLTSVSMPPSLQMIKSGRIKGLAVTSAKRMAVLPDVPTLAESGFPSFEDYTWVGLFAPGGTPISVIQKVNSDITGLLAQPEFKERLLTLGFEPVGGSSDSFAKYIQIEIKKWDRVIKETGTSVQ